MASVVPVCSGEDIPLWSLGSSEPAAAGALGSELGRLQLGLGAWSRTDSFTWEGAAVQTTFLCVFGAFFFFFGELSSGRPRLW